MANKRNTTQAIALAEKGKRWTSDSKMTEIFDQIIGLLGDTDAREEKIERSVKAKRAAPK